MRTQIFEQFALVLIPDSRSCFEIELFIDIFDWSPYRRNFRYLFGTLATRALSFPSLRCRASGRLHNRLKVGSFVSGMPIASESIPFSLSPRLSPATEAVNTLFSHPAWQRMAPLANGKFDPGSDSAALGVYLSFKIFAATEFLIRQD